MGSSFRNDSSGAALVEFTLVFPVVMVIILGVIDVALLMIDWSSYSRITYTGARYAATNAPVASGINADIAGTIAGASCVDGNTGATTSNCTVRNPSTCTATSATAGGSGTCTNSYGFTAAALDGIVGEMQKLLPALDRRQVSVTYTPILVGYVGRPGGYPMNVTVSIRCVQHEFYFLPSMLSWVMPSPPASCNGITVPKGVVLPPFSTTLPSEDLATN